MNSVCLKIALRLDFLCLHAKSCISFACKTSPVPKSFPIIASDFLWPSSHSFPSAPHCPLVPNSRMSGLAIHTPPRHVAACPPAAPKKPRAPGKTADPSQHYQALSARLRSAREGDRGPGKQGQVTQSHPAIFSMNTIPDTPAPLPAKRTRRRAHEPAARFVLHADQKQLVLYNKIKTPAFS